MHPPLQRVRRMRLSIKRRRRLCCRLDRLLFGLRYWSAHPNHPPRTIAPKM